MATNSGLWYLGNTPVVAAYNKGVQVYPLVTETDEDKTIIRYRAGAVGSDQLLPVFHNNDDPYWVDAGDGNFVEYSGFVSPDRTFTLLGPVVRIKHIDMGFGSAFQGKYDWGSGRAWAEDVEDIEKFAFDRVNMPNNILYGFEGERITAFDKRVDVLMGTSFAEAFRNTFNFNQSLDAAFGHITDPDTCEGMFEDAKAFNQPLHFNSLGDSAKRMFQGTSSFQQVLNIDATRTGFFNDMFRDSAYTQDCSAWCVSHIEEATEIAPGYFPNADGFADNCPLNSTPEKLPKWGQPC
jgi:hypothetical protein